MEMVWIIRVAEAFTETLETPPTQKLLTPFPLILRTTARALWVDTSMMSVIVYVQLLLLVGTLIKLHVKLVPDDGVM
jgi:hypothetical protein